MKEKNIALSQLPAEYEYDYYGLKVNCKNCHLSQTLYFTKGVLVSEHSCPNCGCDGTLIKTTYEINQDNFPKFFNDLNNILEDKNL